ncbi:hypothetical protein [Pseudomonas sp. zfem002]|nr:hypothetical protein [Pseudomonas sp. zfem002]MDU9391538.1 hypothetical protein [Pseudomonas sp. zfem002]
MTYDLAWFWKTSPGEMQNLPLDELFESEENAWRINDLTKGA